MYNQAMYALASHLHKLPILSLQTGDYVGHLKEPIIHLPSLELVGFLCQALGSSKPMILMARDIRQLAHDCLLIDHEDEFSDPADIVRFQQNDTLPSSPLRLLVVADTGRKLGVVTDYSLNLETNMVQKIHVTRPALRFWLSQQFTVDRTQIIDISAQQITVRDTTVKEGLLATKPVTQPTP